MSRDLKIFVVDTGPLITLAAARSLDYLLYVNADVVIPDAVLHEATRDANRLGAQDIVDWVKANRSRVEIAATKAYEIFDAARASMPNLRQPDLGERAAVEIIEEPDRLTGEERGVLLCEETAVLKRVVVRDRATSSNSAPSISYGFSKPSNAFSPPSRCLCLLQKQDALRPGPKKWARTTRRRGPLLRGW